MDNRKRRGATVKGILLAGNIGKAVFVFLLLLATTFVASAQPCGHYVDVESLCCYTPIEYKTWGWFYNETGWHYSSATDPDLTLLFHLDVDYGDKYWAYCINYTAPIWEKNTFNASIYAVEPTCKNNSIAYILNNWTIDCAHCENVSAGQSAIWYFVYINDTFCNGSAPPEYNHTADPPVESNWIPNCSAHPKACDFINASINKSVPYNITIDPKTGSYVKGTPVELTATVDYCAGEGGKQVTVVFETDAGNFNENNSNVYENTTVNGILKATLVCDAGIANVTIRVKDMKWFEIVDATGCNPGEEYQETLRVINITNEAIFNFSDEPLKPDIKIVKLVNGVDTYIAVHNEMVTFTLNVTNTGNATLRNIMVNDTLPDKLTWADDAQPGEDSATTNPDGTTTIIWKNNLTELEPGNYTLIRFNATIDPDAESGKTYRNWVTVNATSDYGDVNASDYADVYLERHYQVPVLTPFGIAALIGLLSLVVVLSIRKKGKRG